MEAQSQMQYALGKKEENTQAQSEPFAEPRTHDPKPEEYSGRSIPLEQVQDFLDKTIALEAVSKRQIPYNLEKLVAQRDSQVPVGEIRRIASEIYQIDDETFNKAVRLYLPSAEDIFLELWRNKGTLDTKELRTYFQAQYGKDIKKRLIHEFPDGEVDLKKDYSWENGANIDITRIDLLKDKKRIRDSLFARLTGKSKKAKLSNTQNIATIITLDNYDGVKNKICERFQTTIGIYDPSLIFILTDAVNQTSERCKRYRLSHNVLIKLNKFPE